MEEDFEVDPAIAAAMGFAGFGTQPNKKRRFNPDDGFVDPDAKKQTASPSTQMTGANNLPLGETKSVKNADHELVNLDFNGETAATASVAMYQSAASLVHRPNNAPSISQHARVELKDATPAQLRQGVVDENGDTAYFLPSFIEDPWAALKT